MLFKLNLVLIFPHVSSDFWGKRGQERAERRREVNNDKWKGKISFSITTRLIQMFRQTASGGILSCYLLARSHFHPFVHVIFFFSSLYSRARLDACFLAFLSHCGLNNVCTKRIVVLCTRTTACPPRSTLVGERQTRGKWWVFFFCSWNMLLAPNPVTSSKPC